ncbi:MAG: transcription repressor NadR [Eubacteriales bacterium]|nr:transcription repressor NadR [Eubacteriales bacterium]
MTGDERRTEILKELGKSTNPISGSVLAEKFHVSRQVIVQDIALMRANGNKIYSSNRGYYIHSSLHGEKVSRVLKCYHKNEESQEEMQLIIDNGGEIDDVFVYHRAYGILRADMHIKSRYDIEQYQALMKDAPSMPLMEVTSGYHYHTISADSVEILDRIQQRMADRGFLAKLSEYEPVDFWNRENSKEKNN